jgi:hypothetical protein
MKSAPGQSSPSVEVAGEELATQKEVKLTDPGVEAEGVASAEAGAAPAQAPAPAPIGTVSFKLLHISIDELLYLFKAFHMFCQYW